jgi:hypothetical protein
MKKMIASVAGDKIEVVWYGSVWVAPSCGAQFSRWQDAMRVEIRRYLGACGEHAEVNQIDLGDYIIQEA